MLLHITHTTTYRYEPQVNTAQHMAHLLPCTRVSQQVLQTSLRMSPEPASRSEHTDVYGNACTFFSLPTPHRELTIEARSWVQTLAQALPYRLEATPPWEQVRDHFLYHAGAAWDPATEFVFASPYVPLDPAFADFARTSFSPQKPLLQAACELMHRMHQELTYASQSTDIHTPALQALAQRQGVCQDFAHILLGCLRTQGVAARYISGYLLTQPPEGQPRLIGSDASHAWVSLYIPDVLSDGTLGQHGQWFDLDPTNNRWGLNSPGEDYVTLALGRDYSDVSPVRGVIHGGASHTLQVAVTVLPEPKFAPEVETALTKIQHTPIANERLT